VVADGHEVGHHGYCHENPKAQSEEEERATLERGSELIRKLAGQAPRGYRAPAGSFSRRTVALLAERGFRYDSSLLGDAFTPYYCRVGDEAAADRPYVFGEPVDLVELPFSWNLDDFPAFEFTATRHGTNPGLADPERVFNIWRGEFAYLYERLGVGVYVLTMHPQTIGRGHRMLMLERLLDHIAGHSGVRFETMGVYADRWRREHPLSA
jgi:peptidoglycan/xylan/chitin deacetylase (PgdA/CDA1 family)